MRLFFSIVIVAFFLIFTACKNSEKSNSSSQNKEDTLSTTSSKEDNEKDYVEVETAINTLKLPPPFETKAVSNPSKVVGWGNRKPKAIEGFKVSVFAKDLTNPRWTYVAPNGDYFVAQSTDGSILLFRDEDEDGIPDKKEVFLDGLNRPFGMLVLDDYFYVANTDAVYRYPYKEGMTKMEEEGEKIVDLPGDGHHWTRNLIAGPNEDKLYIMVGSSNNVGEDGMEPEERRANIIEINPDGSGEKIYASGLRNPVGADFNPVTNELWTSVNERDQLGDGLVPDYATAVKEGGFYGWPFSYFGQIKDPRWEDDPHEDEVEKAIVPDVPLGNHTASLGFAFYTGDEFPSTYKNGAFVGQHGSWNHSDLVGYKVVFIPFEDGKPQEPEDFLTGFVADKDKNEVYGRPVGVTQTPDGALLVNDDGDGIIWRIESEK